MLTAILALGACSEEQSTWQTKQPQTTVDPAQYYDDGTGIHWLKGDVDAAFELATQQGKPVFLYWGAEWCPPCHAIKATVFNTPAFRDRSRQFVAVYLDGDTENAQRHGERFGVMGYPTVIVFTPAGEEVTRIPNGIDIEAFAEVLDLAMSSMAPVSNIVSNVVAGAAPSAQDCKLFAYYSWGQDNERILAGDTTYEIFESMARQCGSEHEDRHRLHLLYLSQLVAAQQATGENDSGTPGTSALLDEQARTEALQKLQTLLTDTDAVLANAGTIIFDGADFIKLLTAPDQPARISLTNQLRKAADTVGQNSEMFTVDRIYAAYAKISLQRLDDEDAPISAALKQEILDRVAWADANTSNPHARQAVINAAANVLIDGGLDTQAEALLLREIERSKQPYYFMTTLAELAEKQQDIDAALSWLKRAHEESRGPATRFQWGRYYIDGLIKLSPENASAITQQTVALFEELLATGGTLHHRNARIMDRLEQQLQEWNTTGAHANHIESIRNSVHRLCANMQVSETSRERCDGFLVSA